ncbi:MAG: lysine--tRNA ligase [Deltaproteobacteria bacterium]|nr:lysine--tRNA ligase [Deltaproteobacteria bacterium]
MSEELNEQQQVRREKLSKLRQAGYPYPNNVSVNATADKVVNRVKYADPGTDLTKDIYVIAGRIMALRVMGKASFCHIQDRSGKIQLYIRKDDVGEVSYAAFKTFDLGDIIEVSGYGFLTQTGEPSLHAKRVRLLTKCLNPLPEKWHGLADKEIRYRQRYLDLLVNPEVREVFIKRGKIIHAIRNFFNERGYLEVETPILSSIASGAAARPFVTHHNALDMELHMRIAPELNLKRLVVGGIDRVYEIGHMFRNEGVSTTHNPEFTMIEFYEAYATYETMMDLTEELIVRLCDGVIGSRKIEFDGTMIDYSPGWPRITMAEAIHKFNGIGRECDLQTIEGVRAAAKKLGMEDAEEITDYGKLLFEVFDRYTQCKIVNPTFIIRHPLSISPLSRPADDDPRLVDRFELFVLGMEMANAFSELNDPDDQRERFLAQIELRKAGDLEAMAMDEDYVTALQYGLPPTAGEGIGIDRLVMLLTGQVSIRDVILFPLMRPEQ